MGMQATCSDACVGLSQHEMRVADKALGGVQRATAELLGSLPSNRDYLTRLAGKVQENARASA